MVGVMSKHVMRAELAGLREQLLTQHVTTYSSLAEKDKCVHPYAILMVWMVVVFRLCTA